jgi:putative membrane protein
MEAYIQEVIDNGTFSLPSTQGKVAANMESLDEPLVKADRILNTPAPIAYTIAISQITWTYIVTLPIQLVGLMGWVNVPVTITAAHIILGYAAIGNEIENPFGPEVNDLPLELYCAHIASDIAITTSHLPSRTTDYAFRPDNKLFYPICATGRKQLDRCGDCGYQGGSENQGTDQ